jgi:hypothetical protein
MPTPKEYYPGLGNSFHRDLQPKIFLGPQAQFPGVGIARGAGRQAQPPSPTAWPPRHIPGSCRLNLGTEVEVIITPSCVLFSIELLITNEIYRMVQNDFKIQGY